MNRKLNGITISGSLVVYKPDLDVLEHTLLALQVAGEKVRQNFAARLKLTLVDNSDDPSWFECLDAWVKNRLALLPDYEVTLLCSPSNIGYGRANNVVIERTESDYHFVINPDLFVDPDSLVTALRFMQRSPDVGLLVPSVFGEDGKRHYLCKRNPTLFILFLRSFAPAWLSAFYKSALNQFEMRDRNYNEMIDGVEFPSGCFMFFRTRFLKQLKGFDPDFFMYFEDADIGRRMLRLARIVYVPDVKVVHKWTRGTHSSLRLRYITIKSALIYYKKYSHFKFGRTLARKSFGQITSNTGMEASDRFLPKGRKKNLRILVLVVYYLPSVMSSAKLINDLAREFRSLGHEVIVAAPDETLASACVITMERGIRVFRVRTGEIKLASRWLRGWREMTLSSRIWRTGKAFFGQNPCDLVVYYSPTIFFGSLVARLKRLYACPSYLILRDIFPQWAVDAGILRHDSLIYRFFKRIERRNYDAATVIGVQSPANLDYFSARGLTQRYHLEVLYNWAATTGDRESRTEYRRRLGLEGKVVFFYGGNIGVAQDMDNILRLAERMRDESEAHFLLVGDGSEVPRLRALIAERGLTNTTLHPPVDQEAYLDMLDEFDVGLISLDRGLKTQNFPGKMLSYMDRAKPILASINPGNDLGELLDKHDAGLVCINGDDERFEMLARRLLADRELRVRLGRNAHTLLEERFSVKNAARQILSHAEAMP
jgi:GT2 family glycosyltransferase/glycosyltransferase involved in cell wall biosynthesis